jgi:hypothetical protein
MLTAAACRPLSSYPIDSPYYQPPAGSRLILNQSIVIPPDSATVRFQFGQVVQGVNDFETNCVFELTTVRDVPQPVEPQEFVVTKVRSGSSTRNSGRQPGPGLMKVHFGPSDSGPVRYFFKTEMFLRSDRQPNVLMLTCQHAWETGSSSLEFQRPPTVAEMGAALGAYFTLRLPGP